MKAFSTVRRGAALIFGLTTALALATSGCSDDDDDGDDGGDCESLCEDAKDCPNGDPMIDCAQTCADGSAAANMAGCSSEYDDLLDCAAGEDACAETTVCETEVDALLTCVEDYCAANPNNCA